MQTKYSHPPVISCYLVLYYSHEVEVDFSLLVLVHPRLQNRSAERSHVSTASQQISDSDLSLFTGSTKKTCFGSGLRALGRRHVSRSTGKRSTCNTSMNTLKSTVVKITALKLCFGSALIVWIRVQEVGKKLLTNNCLIYFPPLHHIFTQILCKEKRAKSAFITPPGSNVWYRT
jgi:hypothetical protein